MTAPDMIVVDLDGTLTHVSPIAAKLASVSDRLDMGLSKSFVWAYNTAIQTCDSAGINRSIVHYIRNSMTPMIAREREDSFFILNAACSSHIPCVLLSNGPQKWGNFILHRLALQPFFEKTVFREDMPYLKPDPRSLEPVLHSIPATQGRRPVVWVFGDRESDMILAVNAGQTMPYDFIPVALADTRAAKAIQQIPSLQEHPAKIIFETAYIMACALHPGIEPRLKKYVDERPKATTGVIDSPRLS